MTDLGESPTKPVTKGSGLGQRYDPHEPHSAQIQQPVSSNLLNFKDESDSPAHSPQPNMMAIPESQELALLNDVQSLKSSSRSKEDECDLIGDDFFQNLMKG